MKVVEFIYVEVMNETEQVLVFQATFNGKPYAVPVVLNTALPIEAQDSILVDAITALANMKREDAAQAIKCDDESGCQCKSCKGTACQCKSCTGE